MQKSPTVVRPAACLALLLAAIATAAAARSQNAFAQNRSPQKPPQAIALDGTPFDGRLIAADDDWNLTFAGDGPERKISAADLLRWGRAAGLKRGPVVVLADGGLLRADTIDYDGTAAKIESALLGRVTIPRELLAGLVFELPVDTADAESLLDWTANANNLATNTKPPPHAENAENAKNTGRIRLLNGDQLTGRILSIDDENVRMETEMGSIGTDLRRVEAIRFAPPLKNNPPENALPSAARSDQIDDIDDIDDQIDDIDDQIDDIKAWLGLADGSLLLARRITLDAQKLTISLSANPTDKAADWQASPQELVFLQPIGPKATYLSDLAAAEYRHVPYLQLPWPYGIDRNATGGRLRCGGRLFLKGLGTHSSARLTYLLDKPFSRFEAFTAIDDSTAGRGSVRFRVYVDGRKKYSGPIVRGRDAPIPISLDIRGGKRLDLIVDFGDRADQQDHANWLEARLLK